MTFTQLLQIALAPLLLLWLGSLYNTRYRESLLVGSATNLTEVFPHSINIYPMGRYRELRKRNWAMYHLPKVFAFLYFATRVALLLVFIAPPVVAYLLSLYFLHSDQYVVLFIVIGSLVLISGLANLAVEIMPWHYWKVFPGRATLP